MTFRTTKVHSKKVAKTFHDFVIKHYGLASANLTKPERKLQRIQIDIIISEAKVWVRTAVVRSLVIPESSGNKQLTHARQWKNRLYLVGCSRSCVHLQSSLVGKVDS